MKQVASRPVARAATAHQDFVLWWSTALWALALVYLLATFSIH
jgi:hypothetical protein